MSSAVTHAASEQDPAPGPVAVVPGRDAAAFGWTALLNVVIRAPLRPGPKVLYQALASYAWASDRVALSIARLARDCCAHRTSILGWLADLEAAGWLRIERRPGAPSTYVLLVPHHPRLVRQPGRRPAPAVAPADSPPSGRPTGNPAAPAVNADTPPTEIATPRKDQAKNHLPPDEERDGTAGDDGRGSEAGGNPNDHRGGLRLVPRSSQRDPWSRFRADPVVRQAEPSFSRYASPGRPRRTGPIRPG